MTASWAFYGPFVRRRARWLLCGGAGAVAMVAIRLALPWPLVGIVRPWVQGLERANDASIDSVALGGALFFALFALLGCFDFLARYWFTRFSVDVVTDLRSRAEPQREGRGHGDYLARLVGDTARLKEGMKGFLIHVATNGLLFVGLLALLAVLDGRLAAVFGAALLLTGAVTAFGSLRVHARARRIRKREGQLANTIHAEGRGETPGKGSLRVRPSSGWHRASLTRLQGLTTWAVHGVLGVAIVASLVLARRDGAGGLSEDELLLFLTYMLLIYHPVIRLARQTTRLGKVLACAGRIESALAPKAASSGAALPPLAEGIAWRSFGIVEPEERGGNRRLGPLDLEVPAGAAVAVVGPNASGKSTLLSSLTKRRRSATQGDVLWDGVNLSDVSSRARAERIGGAGSSGDVLVVDDPFDGVAPARRAERLNELFDETAGRTLFVALRAPFELERFDRVVRLERGRIVAEGGAA